MFYAAFPLLAALLLRRDRALWWIVVGVALTACAVTSAAESVFHRTPIVTAVLYVLPIYRI